MVSGNVELLIVEDSRTQAAILGKLLKAHGYRTVSVAGGEEALAHLEKHRPTIVISDIVMPGMDGYQLCRKIKTTPGTRDIPVILLTHLSGPEDIVRGLECGADNFFTKPFDEQSLLARIQYILVNSELRRTASTQMGMEIMFAGQKYIINSDRMQILDLLFSTYETVIQRNEELRCAKEALLKINRKVEGLHGSALALAKAESEDDACSVTVRAAHEVLGFSDCALSAMKATALEIKASFPERPAADGPREALDPALARASQVEGKTFVHGNPQAWANGATGHGDLKSIISAAIGRFGVFQAVSPEPNAFTREDARLLELLLSHTAEALRRISLQHQLRERAVRDSLTGSYNRFFLEQVIEKELTRSTRYGHSIAFLMIDINKFKEINDRYGHLAGDWALKMMAGLLRAEVRAIDLVFRYGGDEFLIVMPETTEAAADVVEKRILEQLALNNARQILEFPVDIAIGRAYWQPKGKQTINDAIAEADRKMYEDKQRSAARTT